MRRWLVFSAIVLLSFYFAAGWILGAVDRLANRAGAPVASLPPSVHALHDSLWIADFHNDALLWNRDLLKRSTRGQLDVPRLRAGGFELAVFSAATRYHLGSNYLRTPPVADVLGLAALASRWPRDAWFDPVARALVLAGKLRAAERASPGAIRIVRTRPDLETLIHAQASGDTVIGAVLLLEGMHVTGGRINAIDSLFAAGFRVFGVAHMFDNEVGGSAHGWRKRGLTPFGRRAVARIDSLGGIIDLAHASRATIDDVLALTSRPVVVSHTGITSACAGRRNLPDEVVERIAARGGLVAIGFWNAAVCGKDARAVARSIRRAIEVAGAGHVALGSDFDGGVRAPFDAAHLATLTNALVDEGLTRAEIRAVMGENERRFLLETLPAGP